MDGCGSASMHLLMCVRCRGVDVDEGVGLDVDVCAH